MRGPCSLDQGRAAHLTAWRGCLRRGCLILSCYLCQRSGPATTSSNRFHHSHTTQRASTKLEVATKPSQLHKQPGEHSLYDAALPLRNRQPLRPCWLLLQYSKVSACLKLTQVTPGNCLDPQLKIVYCRRCRYCLKLRCTAPLKGHTFQPLPKQAAPTICSNLGTMLHLATGQCCIGIDITTATV